MSWLPLKPFNWRNVKETLRNTMATESAQPLTESTRVRPGEGASWVESPNSRDQSQRAAPGGANSRAEVNDHGSKTAAVIALVLSGAALGGVLILAILMHIYWAESRLANLHYADMKAAMLAHGINPNPHLPAESP